MKIGVTLSGGLAKGAFQCGFLKALLEKIPREDIKIVSASSVGILNAYGLCANKIDEIEKLWRTFHYDNVFAAIKDSWINNSMKYKLQEIINKEDKIDIPMYATLSYFPFFIVRYYKVFGNFNKKWIKFFRCALSFPILSGVPSFYKGLPTMDGGACDNIPIYPLAEKHKDLDLLFCIHFDSKYIVQKRIRESKTIVVDLDASLGNSLKKESFNFDNMILNRMVDSGYVYGLKVCNKVFESGYGNLEGIKKSAKELYESEFDERMKNRSIDRVITTLNTIALLFRRKGCIKPLIKEKNKKQK